MNFLLIGVVSQVFSPIAFAPALAAITATILVLNPTFRGRPRTIALVLGLGSLAVPWLLEVLGVLPQTAAIDDTGVHLIAPGLVGGAVVTCVTIIGSFVATLGVGVVVAYRIRTKETEARLRVHLQAWQLRQLVT
jgi:hypothetical protein